MKNLKKKSFKYLILIILLFISIADAEKLSGLIITGLDTLTNLATSFKSFDFVTQEACTSLIYTPINNCVNHFTLVYVQAPLRYDLSSGWGYKAGKVNLDSIKTAPPDSIFNKRYLHVDSIPPDSLKSYLGCVYVLKTGLDPRANINKYLHAKIKILKFIVKDAVNHNIDMVFLWAYNLSGDKDLHTANLDTFHLDTVPTAINSSIAQKSNNRVTTTLKSAVFKVVGNSFTVPEELRGKGYIAEIYDVKGRVVHRIGIGQQKEIDLGKFGSSQNGVWIVKYK